MNDNQSSNFQQESEEKQLMSTLTTWIHRFKVSLTTHKLVSILSGLVILYLSIYFFIGYKIESSIQNYAEELSNSRIIDIYQLEYDRGILGGVIRYDFIVSPSQATNDALADYFPGLDAYSDLLNFVDDFRLNGEIPIFQGPFSLGGFNVMNGSISILPTPFIRSLLPSLSNRTPLINISFLLNFFNNLDLDINVVDYSGSLTFEEEATLEISGFNAILEYNLDDQLARNFSFEIGELSLKIDEDSVTLNSLIAIAENSRLEDATYIGEGEVLFSIESIEIDTTEFNNTSFENISVENLYASALSEVDEENLNFIFTYGGQFKPNNLDSDIYSFDLVSSVENLDYLALDQIYKYFLDNEVSNLEVLTSDIIKAGPTFNIDKFELGINNSFVSLEGSISHPPSSQPGIVSIEQVPLRLGGDFSIEITGNFIEEAIQTYITANQDDWIDTLGVSRNQINNISDLISTRIYDYFDELSVNRSRSNTTAELVLNNQQLFLGTNLILDFNNPRVFEQYFSNESQRFYTTLNETVIAVNAILYPQEENNDNTEESNAAFLESLANLVNSGDDNVSSIADSVQTTSIESASPSQNTSNPTYGEHTLTGGFTPDPYLVPVVAGGSVDISTQVTGCLGNVNFETPDVILNYTPSSFPLYISSTSEGDTTLAILAPDNIWYCDDDSSGLNPGLEFLDPFPGFYSIWVGTYGGEFEDAELRISEVSLF